MDNSEEINDEYDQETSSYYLRSKRRKLDGNGKEANDYHRLGQTQEPAETTKRKNPIMFVPTEVIQNIFQFISYHELSTKVRMVNRRFRVIAENQLNYSFKNLEKKIQTLIDSTYTSLQATEDNMEIKCICKLLNMLEVIKIQHSIIMASIWRYTYNEYYKSPGNICMYAGLLIDVHHSFIWKFIHIPNQLYSPAILRDYAMPIEVTKIVQMSKNFCVHFDKITEEPMLHCTIYSGCKILDLLDAALFAQKTTIYERHTTETFSAKYSYFLNNSWFIVLPINSGRKMQIAQKQRMMHMRLRRMVSAHNDMFMQQAHYERELMLRNDATVNLRKPGNNVYTGYGDVENSFFYYGVMNDGAYLHKFHLDGDEEDDEDDLNAFQLFQNNVIVEPVARNASEEDVLYRIPHLGVRVEVKVKSAVSFAPLKYLQKLNRENRRAIRHHHQNKIKGHTNINILFECYGAYYPRLPTKYEYEFRPRK